MTPDSTLPHVRAHSREQLVDRACRHWEASRQAAARHHPLSPPSPFFTLALSREAGAQGSTVAEEVGRLLGWPVYDHQLLELIAEDMHLQARLLESVDERRQGWVLETALAFTSAPKDREWSPLVTESDYVHRLVKTVLALGVHGKCVIVGRGSAVILPPETTLRVRLMAPVRERIMTMSRLLGISEQEAARQVRTRDRERADFIQDHFLKDPADPRNYDLVVNASRLSVGSIAELLIETLHRLKAGRGETTR
jgi:cytidylate kinase